jgi:hypothetical protein
VDHPFLGHNNSYCTSIGIFTPSDELAKEVAAASEVSGEKFWRMPLEESYWESMKSGVADMVNTGGRQGGSITAALFLKQVHSMPSLGFLVECNLSIVIDIRYRSLSSDR